MSDTMFVSGIQENGKNVEDNQPKRGMIGGLRLRLFHFGRSDRGGLRLYRKAVERLHDDDGTRLTGEEVFGAGYTPVDDGYKPEFE